MIFIIFLIAIYGLITSENLIRKIMCLNMMESVVIYIFLFSGYKEGDAAPIIQDLLTTYVDPVPQALMLTAIVVGVCFNSLALSIIVKIYNEKGSILVSAMKMDRENDER